MDTIASAVRTLRKVLIVTNLSKPNAAQLCDEIKAKLERDGIGVVVFAFEGHANSLPVERFDLAISLGGDGTVLFCARLLARAGVPILPINLGHFGFITEVMPTEWQKALESYQAGDLKISRRMVLSVQVERGGTTVADLSGLNDVVVSTGGTSKAVRIVHFGVAANGEEVARYRADGLIISTPTGSTGYSVAAGGPIMHPELDAIIMNPICPFTLNNRALIFPGNEELKVMIYEHEREDLILTVDGQTLFPIRPDDVVIVRRSQYQASIVRSGVRTFYEVLRRKLGWAGVATGSDADAEVDGA